MLLHKFSSYVFYVSCAWSSLKFFVFSGVVKECHCSMCFRINFRNTYDHLNPHGIRLVATLHWDFDIFIWIHFNDFQFMKSLKSVVSSSLISSEKISAANTPSRSNLRRPARTRCCIAWSHWEIRLILTVQYCTDVLKDMLHRCVSVCKCFCRSRLL